MNIIVVITNKIKIIPIPHQPGILKESGVLKKILPMIRLTKITIPKA
jgi:hypothetical protein